MRIPYGELQTINFTVNNENGHEHVLWRVHYAFVIPCRDCKHSYTAKADGNLRRLCGIVLGYRDDDGYCDRGERRG